MEVRSAAEAAALAASPFAAELVDDTALVVDLAGGDDVDLSLLGRLARCEGATGNGPFER